MFLSPMIWGVAILGIGIPLALVIGARLIAVRAGGRAPAIAAGTTPAADALGGLLNRTFVRNLLIFALLSAGAWAVLLRFAFGIGAVTNLTDQFPWGIWIGFDVMGGVALAAGAFVIAGLAHVFNVKRFEPLVRPAILTGFLGYLLVVAGLVVDLGRPYNIWRPLVQWQHNSVMWEVGLCVFTYTTVLFLEFSPVIFQRLNREPAITSRLPTIPLARLLKRFAIVFIILGVVLSTLHQSSLGSLWVLAPSKLYPLWYTIWLPVFFWISAVAAGLTMTIVESTLSSRAFGRGLELDLLVDLAKGAAIVLGIYLLAKAADLIYRQTWPLLFEPTPEAIAYWLEITLGVIIPMLILAIAPLRRNPRTLFLGAAMVVLFGIVLGRLNIVTVGMWAYTGVRYLPSWTEVAVSLSLVTVGVMAFALAARYLPVFSEHETDHD